MKKLLLLSAILGSITILPSVSTAATATSGASGQVIVVSNQPRFRRGTRTVIRTRIVYRYGRRVRETIRITYRGNRIIRTQVIRRVPMYGRVYRNY